MRLENIVKPIEQMSDPELIEHLRTVRHNREVVRPARAKIVEKAVKKTTRAKINKMDTLLDKLTPAEREALVKQLSGE